MQQKYSDHGRSITLLTTAWPMRLARSLLDGNRLPLQVPDGTYWLGAEQLEAAGLNSSQHDNGLARIELQDGRTDILHGDVDGASSHGVGRFGCPLPCDVLDIAEPLAA
jgi:hypothetical protein